MLVSALFRMTSHATRSTALDGGAPSASPPRRTRRCTWPSTEHPGGPARNYRSGACDRQARAVRLCAVRPQRPGGRAADYPAVDLVARMMAWAVECLSESVVCNSALLVRAQCVHRHEPAFVHAGDDDRICSADHLAKERTADLDEHRIVVESDHDRVVHHRRQI